MSAASVFVLLYLRIDGFELESACSAPRKESRYGTSRASPMILERWKSSDYQQEKSGERQKRTGKGLASSDWRR